MATLAPPRPPVPARPQALTAPLPPPSQFAPVAPGGAESAPGSDTSGPTTAGRRRRILAVVLTIAVGLAFADASVVALALPDLYGELDTTIVGVSWVLTTYALVVAVVSVPVALLHRRVRPAVLAGTGLGLFAAASLAAGLATSLPFLLTARAAQGVGATLLLAGSIPVL